MARRSRRKFSDEFRAETVKLIRDSDKSIGTICRDLDLTPTAVQCLVALPYLPATTRVFVLATLVAVPEPSSSSGSAL